MAISAKYLRDSEMVNTILSKGVQNLTDVDKMNLLRIYQPSWHDSGKIEGITSCDSSSHNCEFCKKMIENARKFPELKIICGLCYDEKQENRWDNVKLRHGLNLKIMSTVSFTVKQLATIPLSEISRINSSGDIENRIHAENMVKLAISHPFAHVGFWTKNFPAVEYAFDKWGKPENVTFVASSPRINVRVKLPRYADYTFTVYDKNHIMEAIANGSMECNGKKCKACGFKCYLKKWPIGSDIAELLRE